MLVEFSFQNCFSFREETNFSMAAAGTVKEMEDGGAEYSNVTVLQGTPLRILRVGAIYGANASGKSNVIKAMEYFRDMVVDSFVDETILENSDRIRFLFDAGCEDAPVSFEMVFIIGENRYRYGFEISDKRIQTEWLFSRPIGYARESYCFIREGSGIKVNSKTFKGANKFRENTRDNALFLSTTAQFNVGTAKSIRNWFRTGLHIIVASNLNPLITSDIVMNDDWMRRNVIEFIRLIDLGIEDVEVTERKVEAAEIRERLKKPVGEFVWMTDHKEDTYKIMDISAVHSVYNEDKTVSRISLPLEMESLGTMKIFSMLGPWFDCLRSGGTLVVDEFGAGIHTQLAVQLIRLFQSHINSDGAQLVVATHDTNLLHKDLLRRDQIWFVEKNSQGVSDLYSLVEYKIDQARSVRNDASFRKDYLVGKYGAIPYFGDIDRFIQEYGNGIQE